MLLTNDYFMYGGVAIPNLSGVGVVPTATQENLTWFIATYEPEYLGMVLGSTLYAAFVAGIGILVPETRWETLKAKIVDTTAKTSMICGYVYFKEEKSRMSFNTQAGQSKPKVQNADLGVNTSPMRIAYNSSMDKGAGLRVWLNDNLTAYPEFTPSELVSLDHLIPW